MTHIQPADPALFAALRSAAAAEDQTRAAWAAVAQYRSQAAAAWLGALGSIAVVATALLGRWFQLRDRDEDEAALHVAAMRASASALAIYDATLRASSDDFDGYKTDRINRLEVMEGMLELYFRANVTETQLVTLLVSTRALVRQAMYDIRGAPAQGDRILRGRLAQIEEMRRPLRDGTGAMLRGVEQMPVFTRSAFWRRWRPGRRKTKA